MFDLSWPSEAGQENVTPTSSTPKRRRRSDALKLSPDEAKAVRVAVRKLARAFGGYRRLGVMLEISPNTVRRIANPNTTPPTGTFAIRLAAVAKVPVEVLLGGKMVVTTTIIGRAACAEPEYVSANESAPPSRRPTPPRLRPTRSCFVPS